MKKVLVVILAVVMLTLLVGSAYAEKDVAITYWYSQVKKDAPIRDSDVVRDFMAENPNIKVIEEEIPAGYMEEKTMLAIVSGAMPNLERDYFGRLAAWAHQGVLESLEGTLTPADLEDFVPGVLNAFRINGKLIGYPMAFWLQTYGVNKTVLDRIGAVTPVGDWTMKEYMAIAEKEKDYNDPDLWTTAFFCKDEQGDYWMLMNFQMFGARLWTDGDYTKTTLNSDAGVKALEWMISLVKDGYAPAGSAARKASHLLGLFNTSKLAVSGAMARQATLPYRQDVVDKGQVSELQDIRLVSVPHIEGIPTPGLYFGPTGVVVFQEEDEVKKAAAMKLAYYLGGAKGCEMICLGTQQHSPRRSLDLWGDEPTFKATIQMMAEYGTADLGIPSPHYLKCRHLLSTALQFAFMGLKSPREALDGFADEVAALWK